ncbi:MAG: hypothetical protein RL112_2602 [Planctomycetota bacterium]
MDAKKTRHGAADLPALFGDSGVAHVAKGKRVETWRWSGGRLPPELVAAALGPSGNLRAPTARAGATWCVGFVPEGWDAAFA